ncbi:unnamed protein product [Cyclocybe aegerita]|uniref:Uncharacterized protein n=1 Tax=Cyclocybe aegerita TaxID=1973307 RepID=A0A8S0Y0T0_CYCAE|nr:unnamed protein product [Cyclocybe aegerita]
MSLCRVCASWRHAALGMPSLWSWLTIPLTIWNVHCYTPWAFDSQEIYIRRNIAELLDWCRRNAARHPVHLRLELYQELNSECIFDIEGNFIRGLNTEEKGYQPIKEFFASNMFGLIKDLDLALSPKAAGKALSLWSNTLSPPIFEKLECLTLRAYATTGPPPRRGTYSRFPSLRRVHLSGKQDIAHLPWDQLTHLCISYEIPLAAWFNFLTWFQNLESMAINITRQLIRGHFLDPPPGAGPRLRHLTYWAQDVDLCVPFPSLTALRLVKDAKDASPIQGFPGLRRNLSCARSITELHLSASIFRSPYSGIGVFLFNEDASPALNQLVPSIRILVIDSINSITENNWMERDLIRLLDTRWIQFSRGVRGRVEFVYNYVAETLPTAGGRGKSEIGGELREYVETYGSSLSYEVIFRMAPEGWHKFTAYELTNGLSGWDEAMGFYDKGSN